MGVKSKDIVYKKNAYPQKVGHFVQNSTCEFQVTVMQGQPITLTTYNKKLLSPLQSEDI